MSNQFRSAMFVDPKHYEECLLRERKAFIEIWHEDKKAEFIRDVIGLANTARLLGEPAYLLMGIEDNGSIRGIGEMLKHYNKETQHEHQVWERLNSDLGKIIARYISPLLNVRFNHGKIKRKPVAYLIIEPSDAECPYFVSSDFPKRDPKIRQGECWLRFGESKQKIALTQLSTLDKSYHFSFGQTPYLLPSKWRRYFENVLSQKEYLNLDNIKGYQELYTSKGNLLKECVERFIEGKDHILTIIGHPGCGKSTFIRRLIREQAEAGLQAIEEIQKREEYLSPPTWIPLYFSLRNFNTHQILQDELTNHLNSIGHFWDHRPRAPALLFENQNLKWLICLDGLDEIWDDESRDHFISSLGSLINRFPRIKIIITSRPQSLPITIRDLEPLTVEIEPFSNDQVRKYLYSNAEEEEAERIINLIKYDADFYKLCSIPSHLEIVTSEITNKIIPLPENSESYETREIEEPVNSGERAVSEVNQKIPINQRIIPADIVADEREITYNEYLPEDAPKETGPRDYYDEQDIKTSDIRLGVVLERMYKNLWEREKKRRSLPNNKSDEWWFNTTEIAYKLDGHNKSCALRKIITEYGREMALWLLNLGILKNSHNPGYVCFFTELTKTYFATRYVLSLLEEGEEKEQIIICINSFTKNFIDRIRPFIRELSTMDLETLSI